MKIIKDLVLKYKSIIMYLVFGVFTTLVNIITYYIFSHILKTGVMFSTIVAWVLAVFFAYITNRKWVFTSYAKEKKEIINEIFSFFSCRIATGIVDWLCMFIFVRKLNFNDVIIKTLANILVIILNYVASKLIIFKKKDLKESNNNILNIITISSFVLIAFIFLLESPVHIWNGSDTYTDSSVFNTIALMMSKGYTPYIHSFDHKGPFIYLINYIGLLINGYRGTFVIELISLSITMIYLFKIARLKCNKLVSFILVILGITLLSNYFEGGNLTEEYALPFISISLYIFLDYILNKIVNKKRLIICGLSCSLVFLLRPNMISTWIVFPIYILIKTIINKDYKNLKQFIIYFLLGFAVGVIPFIIWLLSNHALSAFINEYFLFNKMYTSGSMIEKAVDIYKLVLTFIINPIILVAFIISIYFIKDDKENLVYFIYMLISIIMISMSGKEYLHYMMIFIPCIIYPFAYLLKCLKEIDKNHMVAFLFITYLLINVIFPYWIPVFKELPGKYAHRNDYRISKRVTNITNYIKSNTSLNDKISVYGNSNIFYIVANRMHATKYSYQDPIGYVSKDIMDDYYKELEEELPKIIIVQNDDERMQHFLTKNNYSFVLSEPLNDRVDYKVYELK